MKLIFPLSALAFALLSLRPAAAYQVLVDLNTYKAEYGIDQTTALKCDGIWCLKANSNLTDDQWKTVYENLGPGWVVAEDGAWTQDPHKSYDESMALAGHVDDAFRYNETGAAPKTVLTPEQIDTLAPQVGGHVVVLTRSYAPAYKPSVDAALRNPLVSGVALEIGTHYNNTWGETDALIKTVLDHRKRFYLLADSAKKTQSLVDLITFLQGKIPHEMRSRDVFIVVAGYTFGTADAVYGPTNSLQATLTAVKQLNQSDAPTELH